MSVSLHDHDDDVCIFQSYLPAPHMWRCAVTGKSWKISQKFTKLYTCTDRFEVKEVSLYSFE